MTTVAIGKQARLHRMLYRHGPRNGHALVLPYDQGFEHGPRDFFRNPASADPRYVLRLAVEADFNAVAIHIGLAQRFYWEYAGEVPLILKLNGKTNIPPDDRAHSPLTAGVEDAVRLGADAVGYTLYVGSPAQSDDLGALATVRRDAERFGMPLIVWAYPRGDAIDRKGGKDSLYAVDYAARVAAEVGADVVKVNFPLIDELTDVPAEYADRTWAPEGAVAQVVSSAAGARLWFSGGSFARDEDKLHQAKIAFAGGASGLIFGRNVWQRPHDEAIRFAVALREIAGEAGVPAGPVLEEAG